MSIKTLYIKPFQKEGKSGPIRVDMQMGTNEHKLFFESQDIPLANNMDAFLTLGLLPCMKHGERIVVGGEVSPKLLESIRTLSYIYCSWHSSLQMVNLEKAAPVKKIDKKEQRVGVFFSGGLDSFYTFLKHRDEITDLIFVHGFDISLDNNDLHEKATAMVRDIGAYFEKRVIEVKTNLRLSFIEQYVGWGIMGHGPALTCIGHLLYPYFQRIYIASSRSYQDLFPPWGSHPLLDPLWSSETLEFVHDGCEATRLQKVVSISKFDKALQSLRVCYENRDGTYNCGQCRKCLSTMIDLSIVGALDRCTTFKTDLDINKVSQMLVFDGVGGGYIHLKASLEALEQRKGDRELYNALKLVLNRPRWRTKMIRETRRIKSQFNNMLMHTKFRKD